MIGKLKGIVDEKADDYVLVDVNGVCYVVHCSERTIAHAGKIGDQLTLFIETYLREDQLKLFGFASAFERQWFLLLQSVQGIGAKLALALLSKLSPGQLANAIALQDKSLLSKTPGVGPKAAERIVLELKNKLPKNLSDQGDAEVYQDLGGAKTLAPVAEAISGLTNLGYSRDQAANAISAVIKEVGQEVDTTKLIRLGLRHLSKP
ncbi:Holliday junction branch migration protein RuvA [Rhizobium sp. MHM7A]|uniref:Holliday junction branch migration protein RuvA n=1 Tax=Rhizobium sp. MHM7A TaxID=2583233 RepID=UPI00110736F5|nr:Holliday junction branch migration protein RuvA [Rhizobium sp. MHM7A]TLX16106.1 Holliday junction branch migration protein RuvA [Rhizobium sp. MHM7A]